MSDWTSYVGTITGIIGAITGTSGAIMGYVSYCRSKGLKILDLRLELRKAASDFHSEVSLTRELIDKANRSRQNVSAARGMSHSGQMRAWGVDIERDKRIITQLANSWQKAESEYHAMSERDLETGLVTIHQLQGRIKTMKDHYLDALRRDEELSRELGEGARASFSPPHS